MVALKLLRNTLWILFCLVFLTILVSCTEYERDGVNSRPFNEPADWENYPYRNAFRN